MRPEVQVRNVLTIDVEEYFHVEAFRHVITEADWSTLPSRVEANVEEVLGILDRHGVRATFFVLGWVAERRPALVRRIAGAGHEIACHSYAHRLIYAQSRDAFTEDVRRAKTVIEDAVGDAVRGYRAPSFSIVERSLWALETLVQAGFTYDSSIFPIRHDRYGIAAAPRGPHRRLTAAGPIWELPPATARLMGASLPVAGGGYLRHFPPAVMRWGLRRLNEEGLPAVVYLHPWELDAQQPRQRVGRLTAWRHYTNLAATAARLGALLGEFAFGPAEDLVSRLRRQVPADVAAIAA